MRTLAYVFAAAFAGLLVVLYLPFRLWLSRPECVDDSDPDIDFDDPGVDVDDFRDAP